MTSSTSSPVQRAIAALDSLPPAAELTSDERTSLGSALHRALSRSAYQPFELVWEMCLAQPLVFAACLTCLDVGLWPAWRSSAGGTEKTVSELAALCHPAISPDLLRRLLRLLAARHVVEEVGPDRFRPATFSLALGEHGMAMAFRSGEHHWLPSAFQLPPFLRKHDFREPMDAEETPYQDMPINPEKLTFFGRCGQVPEIGESFASFMAGITAWKQDWTDYFDTGTLLADPVDNSAPVLVDVGGNMGGDVMRFLAKHSVVLPGHALVLQDTAGVVALAADKIDAEKVHPMAHDFFQPQPVKGARAYLLHSILHDWPDDLALQILERLREACRPGYSRLLVCDVVVPPQGASVLQAAHDLCLMALLSARERTAEDWRALLGRAGFRVRREWKDRRGVESVIEAEVDTESG